MLAKIINGRPVRTQVESLVEHVKAMKDGEAVSHAEVEKIIGEIRTTGRYRSIINGARRRLHDELGVSLLNDMAIGYHRAKGPEQLRHGVGYIARAARVFGKGLKTVAAVSDERLTSEADRKARDFIVQKAREAHERARLQSREIKLILGTPEAMAR